MMFLMWEYQRFMVHLSHISTTDHLPQPSPTSPLMSVDLKFPNVQKGMAVPHMQYGHAFIETVPLHIQWSLLCLFYTNACTQSHMIHHMTCAAGVWSESMLWRLLHPLIAPIYFSFLLIPTTECTAISFSVMVTCKGTCGVTDVVCSRQITSPEIDQPFCLSLPVISSFPFIFCIYLTVLLSVFLLPK